MPNISIITTTYQHADFIAQTIESVLGQTYSDWEMLIGDDSPDDATWDVIQWYVAKYPTKIKARHHSPNKGIVDNMNFLIQQCDSQSDFISFLEGDDMYTADNLMEKIKIFEKYPEVQLVYSDFQVIDTQSVEQRSRQIKFFAGLQHYTLEGLLDIGNPIQSFGAVCMTQKAMKMLYPLSTPTDNTAMFGPLDYRTWTRILPHIASYGLNQKLLHYRKHHDNFTKKVTLFNQQLEVIYRYYIQRESKNLTLVALCQRYIITNHVIGNMFAHTSSFIYLYHNKNNISPKLLCKLIVYSTVWLFPSKVFDHMLQVFQSLKYRHA